MMPLGPRRGTGTLRGSMPGRRILAALLVIAMTGCVKRTISITSEPAGALVWVNDREVGRTPVDVAFTYYGEYDVRLDLPGYEPIMTSRWIKAPVWDQPVADLVAEAWPRDLHSNPRWEFSLAVEEVDDAALIERARSLRGASGADR